MWDKVPGALADSISVRRMHQWVKRLEEALNWMSSGMACCALRVL